MSRPKLLLCLCAFALPAAGIPLISGAAAKGHHKQKTTCKVSQATGDLQGATVIGQQGGTETYSLAIDCTVTNRHPGEFKHFTLTSNKHVQSPTVTRAKTTPCKLTGAFSFSCTAPLGGGVQNYNATTSFTSPDRCTKSDGWTGTVTVKVSIGSGKHKMVKLPFKGKCLVSGFPI